MSESVKLEQWWQAKRAPTDVAAFRDGEPVTFEAFERRCRQWRTALVEALAWNALDTPATSTNPAASAGSAPTGDARAPSSPDGAGAGPGRCVALCLPDAVEFAAALFAAWDERFVCVLAPDAQPGTVEGLRAHANLFAGDFTATVTPSQHVRVPAANAAATGDSFRELNPADAALVLFTSGSSGKPSAIPKAFHQLSAELVSLERLFGARVGKGMPIHATVSHAHIYGLLFRLLWPLCNARPFDATSCLYPEDVAKALVRGPGVLVSSPAFLTRLAEAPRWPEASSLRAVFSSGGALPEDAARRCEAVLGHAAFEIYGSSETGGVGFRERVVLDGVPSAERPFEVFPGVSVTTTEASVLRVRSPHLPSDAPEFETADRAADVADDGRSFRIVGRVDRLVKLEEKRVSLTAMESALVASGLFDDVRVLPIRPSSQGASRWVLGVVGVPTSNGWRTLGSRGKPGMNAAAREALLTSFERTVLPRRFRYVTTLPKNPQGKVTEAALTALFDDARGPEFRLLERTDDSARLALNVDAKNPFFEGHFPEAAILPGVVQVDWAMRAARDLFAELPAEFGGMEALKFRNVIVPDTKLELSLRFTAAKGEITFEWKSEKGVCSSGRILLQKAEA